MAIYLKEDVSTTIRIGPFLDSTDGFTAETALTPTVQLSKNGGAFAARSDVTALAHDADGWYSCVLNTTDTNTAGNLQLKSVVAGALPVWHELTILPALVYDSLIAGTDTLQVDVTSMAAGTVTAAAVATDAIDADAIAANAIDAASIATGAITNTKFAAGAIDAAAIATDAIGAAEFAQAAADKVWATAARTLTSSLDPSAATIADAVWDEQLAGHVAVGSFGQVLQVPRTGTAQAGGAQTITLDAGASAVNDYYFSGLVNLTGGTGAGQSRRIRDYVGATKVASVTIPWFTQPDATSQFVVTFDQSSWDELRADHIITNSFGEGIVVSANGLSSAAITSNAITAAKIATGAITAAKFAASAIDAAALATDAVAEIADGVWDEPIAGHLTAGSTGVALNGATAPSAAVVADAVWDELIAGHLGAGSTGAALNAAGGAGDPWITALPGAYGVGTAGNIVGNRLDVAVSTRSTITAAQVGDLPWDEALAGHLTAGSTGAKLNSLTAAGGGGATQFVYTLTRSDNGQPIDDAQVDVYASADLLTLVTSGRTNAQGKVTFFLDSLLTYYFVRTKSGFSFVNPDVEQVP